MACKWYLVTKEISTKWIPHEPNRYWSDGKKERGCIYHEGYNVHECAERGVNNFWGVRQISKYWEYLWEISDKFWEASEHLVWICGDTVYTSLPGDCTGSCTIGVIKPAFFLLPKESGSSLGIPLYDDLRKINWKKRDTINMGSTQKRKGEIWTPKEIIKTYGPAAWAQNGSWGYHTLIHMLNRIIRLQAVLETVSNNGPCPGPY